MSVRTVANVMVLARKVRCADHQAGMPPPDRRWSAQRTLPASQAEAPHLHCLPRLLAYVCTAILAASVNASLVGILIGARPSFPPCLTVPESPDTLGRVLSQVAPAIQSCALRHAHPRAPPIPAHAAG